MPLPTPIQGLTSDSQEQHLSRMLERINEFAIYLLSPEGSVKSWNAGAQRFKGYRADEIIGIHFSRFYTPEDQAAGKPARALQIAARDGLFEEEGWRVRKDGTLFWAHVIIDAIRAEDGSPVGYAKITRDITAKKKSADELESTRQSLLRAQRLGTLGKLTGGIAHDFNNLLTVILNGLQIMQSDPKRAPRQNILEGMQRAATRGAAMTQQLLAYARQQPLVPRPRDINQVVGSMETMLRAMVGSANRLALALDLKRCIALVDEIQLEAALLNLISNARDAMPDEGGLITIATRNLTLSDHQIGELPAGQFVEISIRDTGARMTEETRDRATEPFFTTKQFGSGTGMGLSQVFGFVQQSMGDLVIESSPGNGTVVRIFLPAPNAASDAEATGASFAIETKALALVVDDQTDVLEMASELLKTMGFEVLSAGDAAKAIDLIECFPDISLLFTDFSMPGMNGIELARQARTLRPGLPILINSGFPAATLGTALDEFTFVRKPYSIADLVRALQ